jgi:hypothetical protein
MLAARQAEAVLLSPEASNHEHLTHDQAVVTVGVRLNPGQGVANCVGH